jgi:hypothetical protein
VPVPCGDESFASQLRSRLAPQVDREFPAEVGHHAVTFEPHFGSATRLPGRGNCSNIPAELISLCETGDLGGQGSVIESASNSDLEVGRRQRWSKVNFDLQLLDIHQVGRIHADGEGQMNHDVRGVTSPSCPEVLSRKHPHLGARSA